MSAIADIVEPLRPVHPLAAIIVVLVAWTAVILIKNLWSEP